MQNKESWILPSFFCYSRRIYSEGVTRCGTCQLQWAWHNCLAENLHYATRFRIMHPKGPTLSSETSLHLASPISSNTLSFVKKKKRWEESKALLSLLFVSTFAHLHFYCCSVELIYQTFLKVSWQNCSNVLLWQNMNSSLHLFRIPF